MTTQAALRIYLHAAIVSALDCEVMVATDGVMAIAIAEDWRPDIVLLDLIMPGMDGYEVADRLPPGTKVVAVSGVPPNAALARRFDRYLAKPVLKDAVAAVIRQLAK